MEITEKEDNKEKLLSYQIPHKMQLHECLMLRDRVLDASDTGTGKTYVAISECKDLGLRPFIICPKSVVSVWVDVCKIFGVEYLGISNYEMLKGCKYYTENYEPTKCPYMDKIYEEMPDKQKKPDKKAGGKIIINAGKNLSKENKLKYDLDKKLSKKSKIIEDDGISDISDFDESDEEDLGSTINKKKNKKENSKNIRFQFYLPDDVIVIFDEAHRCKNLTSQTSKLLMGFNECKNKIMILSATITDKLKCFRIFGMFFRLYTDPKQFRMWMDKQYKLNKHKYEKSKIIDVELIKLDIIHRAIFPNYGSRMKIKELGDLFPQNQIQANCYYLENHVEIEKVYQEINNALVDLATKEFQALPLPALIYCRQKIEMLKVTLFMDLALEGLSDGFSVVIFVNFLETMNYLCYHMKQDVEEYGGIGIIMGGQTIEERKANIDNFQNNKIKFLISTIESGGVGISLHDIHGGHPRMSIISPTWTATTVKQAIGRIHRAGAKTPAIQKIIYVAKTYEENICQLIKDKFNVIEMLNDGDLAPNIPKEVLEELEKPEKVNEDKVVADNLAGKIKKEDLEEIAPIEERIKQVKKKVYKKSNKDTKKHL